MTFGTEKRDRMGLGRSGARKGIGLARATACYPRCRKLRLTICAAPSPLPSSLPSQPMSSPAPNIAYCNTCGMRMLAGKVRCDTCVLGGEGVGAGESGVSSSTSFNVASHRNAGSTEGSSRASSKGWLHPAAVSIIVALLSVITLSCAASVYKSANHYRTSELATVGTSGPPFSTSFGFFELCLEADGFTTQCFDTKDCFGSPECDDFEQATEASKASIALLALTTAAALASLGASISDRYRFRFASVRIVVLAILSGVSFIVMTVAAAALYRVQDERAGDYDMRAGALVWGTSTLLSLAIMAFVLLPGTECCACWRS